VSSACAVWSPDGTRLACDGFNATDPTAAGVHTIRSSDGGGFEQVTSIPGGDDFPCSYSPNGSRILFIRTTFLDGSSALFVVNVNGTGLKQITSATTLLNGDDCGDWSPQGNEIVFSASASADVRRSLWVVHADGSGGLHQIPIAGCGGSRSDPNSVSCRQPAWSPDGEKIVFDVNNSANHLHNIYTVNADGTGLFQVTHGTSIVAGEGDGSPDWGVHPLAS
jgi:hypothetical protein